MKFIYVFLAVFLMAFNGNSQQLTEADIPQLVDLVDQQIDLNKYQQMEMNRILKASLKEHTRIQRLQLVDVEKLQLIQKNQNATRDKIEVILQPDQFQTYEALLDGSKDMVQNVQPTLTNTNVTTLSNNQPVAIGSGTAGIADQLGLTGTKKTEFVMIYDAQQKEIDRIANAGSFGDAAGVDLLTSILTTDFKILDLGGKNVYDQYFQMRQNGQFTNGAVPSNQKVDINQVYMFHDIKNSLKMNDAQTESFIRLFLESEVEKRNIRKQYKGNGSMINQKLKALETDTFNTLGTFLSQGQVQKLLQLLGG